jgi:hypothetical protein
MNMPGYGRYEYSAFNARPNLCKGVALGVPLTTLVAQAGIDNDAMCRLYLQTEDGYDNNPDGTGKVENSYLELVDTTRYYFGDLPNYWNFKDGEIYDDYNELWTLESTVEVPTIISIQSRFQQVTSIDEIETIWNNHSLSGATSSKGYRLFEGQSSPNESSAYVNTHSIQAIYCVIGGRNGTDLPEIELEQTAFEGKVGDEVTVTPSIKSQDQTVSDQGIKNINWRSSDESVCTVTRNEDGSITIKFIGEGTANITASYGDSQYGEYVAEASFGAAGSGTGKNGFGAGHGESSTGDADAGTGLEDFVQDVAGSSYENFNNESASEGEGDDPVDSAGTGDSVVLTAGTQLFSASLSQEAGATATEASSEGGGGGDTLEAGSDADITDIEVQVTPQDYKLDFEKIEEEITKAATLPVAYALYGALALLLVGVVIQVLRFNRAKDPHVKKQMFSKPLSKGV